MSEFTFTEPTPATIYHGDSEIKGVIPKGSILNLIDFVDGFWIFGNEETEFSVDYELLPELSFSE